jgi:penicillin-binding protein 1B
VVGLLHSLGIKRPIAANPSLLLGAIDLSPLEVAQMYQFLAAGGHALPLISVSSVLGKDGKAIKRYAVKPGAGEYHTATGLVTYAMQQVAQTGTAHAIDQSSLSGLHVAGKTGTSDSQRDSWFAGFTGSHLAVAWVGRDDNKPTALFGATGGLKVWIDLFRQLPTEALPAEPREGVEYAQVNPADGRRSEAGCPGTRRLPFAAGYAPGESEGCLWQRFQDIFQGGDTAPPTQP